MEIADLNSQPEPVREQAAALLVEAFDEPRGWPTIALAREEVAGVLRDGFARAMMDGQMMPDANGRGRPDLYMSKRLDTESHKAGSAR